MSAQPPPMHRFKVTITSNHPYVAKQALDAAGIPTIGPAFSYWNDDPSTGTWSSDMTAVLDADNEDAALERLRAALSLDDEIGPAEPLP